jgi:hypothetical protein
MFSAILPLVSIVLGQIDPADDAFNALQKKALDFYDLEPPYVNDYLQIEYIYFNQQLAVWTRHFD